MRIFILLLIFSAPPAFTATHTVEVGNETRTEVTYKITHQDGIWRLVLNYEPEDMDPAEVTMVTTEKWHTNCLQSVTITVKKEKQLEGDNTLGFLSNLVVEDFKEGSSTNCGFSRYRAGPGLA